MTMRQSNTRNNVLSRGLALALMLGGSVLASAHAESTVISTGSLSDGGVSVSSGASGTTIITSGNSTISSDGTTISTSGITSSGISTGSLTKPGQPSWNNDNTRLKVDVDAGALMQGQACFYADQRYSQGAVLSVGNILMRCIPQDPQFNNSPLEWQVFTGNKAR
ncbi:DUF1496 domain-containing protein [Plesiomonas shigelloides]|uniref:DUF1496 domain-containing protein n=2 Tax=Plesiomonas shigelloides TaxID=703 RepID=R8ANX5_PLESH|nr:DUF1496 domain-containing protein [Plesiomonas shigelloides]EON88008.1 hypothetical protein PLESHI_12685 [Plesiomonas shigelloides 302-73]KAB7669621.1 DUF1496 domain-containing protein [Plesiomonas shigelloides]KAB7688051.1 DUF1496 domain-containing protein [Plesiomonas shigelloides]MBO1107049.1 DUF1496 domain-containing protein [Plesiomonas shigelloides]QWK93738.1 YnjH family protein [Plesiomonas shigelloides]